MTPTFEILWETKYFTQVTAVNVSRCHEIQLIDANTVCSRPDFKHAVVLPIAGNGHVYFYPDDLTRYTYRLNENEIELPSDNIEHFYTELYTILHKEYIDGVLEEL